MKKIVTFLVALILYPAIASGQLGIYGSVTQKMDSVRANFVIQDTLGKTLVAADSINIVRFYNGAVVDSIDQFNSRVTNPCNPCVGYYEVAYNAAKSYDSVGIYTIWVSAWYKGWNGGLALSYQVTKGGLDNWWTLVSFLGACDGCLRQLYPLGGGYPKDSGFVIDTSKTPDDTLLYLRFKHGTVPNVMDSMTTDVR